MRGAPVVAWLLMAAPALASANELLDVYRQAVDNDPTLQAARYQRDASVEARPQARAGVLPSVNGGYERYDGKTKGSSRFSNLPEESFDDSTSSESLSLTLSQPVFDWAAFKRLAQSSDSVALAEVTYRTAEQDLVLRTATAYFNLLSAADDLRFASAQRSALERQLEQAQKRFDVGLSAITDVQEAQASYDLTVADVILSEQSLAAAKEALAEITGVPADRWVPLVDEIPLPGPDPASVDAWIDTARENNPNLIAARITTQLADADIGIARAGHYPTVSVIAQYVDANRESGDQSSDTKSNTVGVQVNVPIFSGGYTRSQVSQAQSTYERRAAEQEASRRSVDRQVRDAYLGVLTGASRVRALKQAVISNTTALDASETGLQVGTRTTVDVLNAQSLLYSAQRDYARARYDYLLSILKLKSAAGGLGIADLSQIDHLLVGG